MAEARVMLPVMLESTLSIVLLLVPDGGIAIATVLVCIKQGLLPAGQQAANEMAAVSLLQAQALHQLQQQQQCNSPPPLHSAASRRVRLPAKWHTTLHCGWAPLTAATTQSHHGQGCTASPSGSLHAVGH